MMGGFKFLSQFFETSITAFILTLDVSLARVSSFRWVFCGQCVFLTRKKLFKLSIKLLAKIRFPISSKCKPSRKRFMWECCCCQ